MNTMTVCSMLMVACMGCSVASDEVPPAEVAAAERAWLAQGLPLSERCFAEQMMLGKVVTTHAQVMERCQVYEPGLEGCYHVRTCDDGYVWAELLIVVDERYDRPWLDLHELGHWLGDCSEHGADPGHEDERVWGKRGVVEMAAKDLR